MAVKAVSGHEWKAAVFHKTYQWTNAGESQEVWSGAVLPLTACIPWDMHVCRPGDERKEKGGPIHFKPTASPNSLLESQPTKELSPCSAWYTSAGEQTTPRFSGETQACILVCGWAGCSYLGLAQPLLAGLCRVSTVTWQVGWGPTSSGLIHGVSPGSVHPSSSTFAQACSRAGQGMWPEGLLDSGLEVIRCKFRCSVLAKESPLFC